MDAWPITTAVRRLLVIIASLAAILMAAPAAQARSDLWSTVNICDAPGAPNMVGVRTAMPGNGTTQRMYMRVRLQYFSVLRQGWFPVRNAVSPKIRLGSARRDRQGGYTFRINPPTSGGEYNIRGVARLEWQKAKRRVKRIRVKRDGKTRIVRRRVGRASWKVARRSEQVTKRGIRGVKGGTPPGTSLGACTVR